MKCKKIEKLLLDFVEGKIEENKKNEIQQHINSCENCKSLYKDILFLIEKSQNIKIPEVDEMFWKEKLNSIITERPVRKFKIAYVPLVSFIFLLIFSLFFYKFHSPKTSEIVKLTNIEKPVFLSEEEILKYADYLNEEEAAEILNIVLSEYFE